MSATNDNAALFGGAVDFTNDFDNDDVSIPESQPAQGQGAEAQPQVSSTPSDGQPAEPAPTPQAAPVPVAAPVPQPTPSQVTPPAQPVATPPAAPQQPAQAQPPAQPQAQPVQQPPAPTMTREQEIQEIQARRESLQNDIAQRYGLSEQDKEQWLTEPEKVVPRMAARLYVDVFDSVFQAVFAQVPQLMMQFMEQRDASRGREESFYKRWPMLSKPEYKPTINRLVGMYRQFNPQVPFEQMLEDVGVQALTALKIPLDQLQPAAQAPAAPAAAAPAPVPAVRHGYQPAAPGGVAPVPTQQKSTVWDELLTVRD